MPSSPALPPLPTNVVPMPKKMTVTITGPDGKTSGPVDTDALARLADQLEAGRKGKTAPKRPGRRPNVTADPEEVAKLEDALGEEATAEMRALDHAELRERVVSISEHEVETEQAMKKDEDLAKAREAAKEAQAPYRETIKFLKMRRRLAILLLQERGRPVSA